MSVAASEANISVAMLPMQQVGIGATEVEGNWDLGYFELKMY
jgi:hypothetical protein